jgi:fructose-bisphosphate aldolase class II
LIAQLAAGLDVPLVLHGSSGVPDDELRRAAAAGIRKINVGTALNIAYTGAVRAALSPSSSSSSTDPRRYLTPARDAMADVVAHLLSVLSP